MNYTVIQNFDSSEFQANGHHKFEQRRQTAQPGGDELCIFN
ncbi:hypothetical protein [Nostoc flagelliforme]|nr:hypothetical protein [Nostoc flagelliforme]